LAKKAQRKVWIFLIIDILLCFLLIDLVWRVCLMLHSFWFYVQALKVAKKLKTNTVSGYSNDSNPFGDSNLNEK
jgi:hypothetical protein